MLECVFRLVCALACGSYALPKSEEGAGSSAGGGAVPLLTTLSNILCTSGDARVKLLDQKP